MRELTTSEKIRALPWKGNALADIIGPNSTLDIANDLIAREPDNTRAWEAEVCLHLCAFGELIKDEDRAEWEAMNMR